jgi:hypothetical protein
MPRKSPRRKSPRPSRSRRKSPRRKSPRRKSPRRKSPRKSSRRVSRKSRKRPRKGVGNRVRKNLVTMRIDNSDLQASQEHLRNLISRAVAIRPACNDITVGYEGLSLELRDCERLLNFINTELVNMIERYIYGRDQLLGPVDMIYKLETRMEEFRYKKLYEYNLADGRNLYDLVLGRLLEIQARLFNPPADEELAVP